MKKLISIFCVLLILASTFTMVAHAGIGDNHYYEKESNNSLNGANILYNDYTVSGDLSAQYDMDYYMFTLSSAADVHILCQCSSSTLMMGLYDAYDDEEVLAVGTHSTSSKYYYDSIDITLPAGTYYFIILQKSNYSDLTYLFYFDYQTTTTHTHSYTSTVTEPTCTAAGYTTYRCSCGDSYVSNNTSAKGHTESGWITDINATCTSAGSKYKKCTVCGVRTLTESVPAIGHDLTDWVKISADKQERHCTSCNYSEEQNLEAAEHQWGDWVVTVTPSCEVRGERMRTCSICGEIETEFMESNSGHVIVSTEERAPTCTQEGSAGGFECSVCGVVLTEPETIPVVPHNEIREVTKKATLEENGEYKIYCDMCGEIFEEDWLFMPEDFSVNDGINEHIYNGKTVTVDVFVGSMDGTYYEGIDYDVVYPDEIKKPGRYTITINFKGDYEGTKELYFDVLPAVPKTFKAETVTSSSISLKWSASTGATGYRIYQYSPSKGTYVLKKSIKGSTTYKRTGLKGSTSYTFKIQPYTKLADGTVLWGEEKEVTTKTKSAYSVSLSGSSATLYVGGTKQLKATTTPSGKSVTWKSSKTSVATVSSSGKVTAKKAGTATITVSFKYKGTTYKDTYKITVKKPTISLNKTSASLVKGKTLTLKATTAPDDMKVTWKSSSTSVATVSSSGKVTAKKAGSATITASFTYKGTTYKKTCKITVTNSSTTSAQDNITSLIKYIKANGSTNKNGDKMIKKSGSSGDYTFTFGIVYDSSEDCLNFVSVSEYDYYGGVNGTDSMTLNRKGTSADFETIYIFDDSYGDPLYVAQANYTMKPSSYYDEYDVYDYWSVNTFPDSLDIDELVFSGLRAAMEIWDSMVKDAIGVGLKGIGFTHY